MRSHFKMLYRDPLFPEFSNSRIRPTFEPQTQQTTIPEERPHWPCGTRKEYHGSHNTADIHQGVVV
jgi:hypothetical protein